MKKAVILFNLGGPDSLDAVKPFLFNLFYDKNIITIPNPMRFFLAKLISKKRTPIAQEIYKLIGNKSPILEETQRQAVVLEEVLNRSQPNHFPDGEGIIYKTFVSMRYWHPFSYEVIEAIKESAPDEIILLPLYPQYSTTTSKSSIDDWQKVAKKNGLNIPTKIIYNYHLDEDFINAHVNKIRPYYEEEKGKTDKLRILFSAHGLPEKIINAGDPYQKQVEQTAASIVENLAINGLDWKICYQSRVGPLKWIGPSTDDEIKIAGQSGYTVIIVPIAFVSEHSETLVELDIEYKHLAYENGVKNYIRVPALGSDEGFINALVNNVKNQVMDKKKNETT